MKISLSDASIYGYPDAQFMIHFARQSIIEAGNKTMIVHTDFMSDKDIYEVEFKPKDVPFAGVFWEVVDTQEDGRT